jgi:hypothetical protein
VEFNAFPGRRITQPNSIDEKKKLKITHVLNGFT